MGLLVEGTSWARCGRHPPPPTIAGPAGAIATVSTQVKIGDNNIEYSLFSGATRIKAGTTVTFTNVGDIPHTATSFDRERIGNWDTGALAKGESKTITFDKPGNYYYICTPHPWMYGQIIVE